MKISVIIPAYKNKDMLLENLRINHPYLKECEIVVVDDASGEGIVETIKREFPKIKTVENAHNLGFGESVNIGVKNSIGEYLFLLNNDVVLKDNSYKNSVDFLEKNQDYFAVSFMQKEKNGQFVGKNALYSRRGFIFNKKSEDIEAGLNGWAEGGSAIINRKYFNQLNGFSHLFSPAYYEDIELSYRAYKRGLKVYFDPLVCVEHHHESTTGTVFSKNYKKTISYRNHFVFMWKNITDTDLLVSHLFYLPYYFVKHTLVLDFPFFKGFFEALFRLPKIMQSRNIEKKHLKLTDKQILKYE